MNKNLYLLLCLFFNNTFFTSHQLSKQILFNSSKSIATISPKLFSCLRSCSNNSSDNNNFENIASKIDEKNLQKLFEEILQEQKNQNLLFEKILNEQTQQRIILETNKEKEKAHFSFNKIMFTIILNNLDIKDLKKSRR